MEVHFKGLKKGVMQENVKAHFKMHFAAPRSSFCKEHYMIGNTFNHELMSNFNTGTITFEKEYSTREEVADMYLHGLRINMICIDQFSMFSSALATARMVFGGMARLPYIPIIGEGLSGP